MPAVMVLSPLEFSECFLDSPEFREKLHAHENELEKTNKAIKDLIRDGKALLAAARNLSKAQRAFSETLINFNFECIGASQTDAEIDISQSLKEFGRLIALIEDERDRMLEHAKDQLIVPLEAFRKEQIGSAKEGKKAFERQTEKFCKSLDSYVSLSTRKKEASLQEADAALDMERRQFHRDSLTYVFKMQEVQEKKKFEFVETLLGFMYSWLTFYHQGHEVSREFKPYMTELQLKLQNIRAGFDATRNEAEILMHKMMEKPLENKKTKTTQEGYLFMYEKRALGSSWIKQYCRYNKDDKKLMMQQYVQTLPKVTSEEEVTVLTCTRRMTESIEKRFCFDITVMEKPNVLTLQAVTEQERNQWMHSMGGKEPVYLNPAQISKSDENLLNDIGFHFIRKCIEAIESRGLDDQGLYRVVGVNSKVQRLTSLCLADKRKPQNVNLSDSGEWEIKTITSALKNYFRNLPEPLMSHRLHDQLIAAAKQESKTLRVNDIHAVVHQLPEPNFEMLDNLIGHLHRVASNCEKNLMTVANLGVCFGPTLMRPEEETMKAIMDIKFSNIVVEILITHYEKIFKTPPDGMPPALQTRTQTPNFPNSASSSISSSSSASSSRASPRHPKSPTPNSVKDPKLDQQPQHSGSISSSGASREHSPRRPGESKRNKWHITLRRVESVNRANNNATHLQNGGSSGLQTLPRSPPFQVAGNSVFYTKPMRAPQPLSSRLQTPPPILPRSKMPQSEHHSVEIPQCSMAPNFYHVAGNPQCGTTATVSKPQHGIYRPGEQTLIMESGRVAALRRRFQTVSNNGKPGLRSDVVDVPKPSSSVAALARIFQKMNHNPVSRKTNRDGGGGGSSSGGAVASSGTLCVGSGVVLRKPRRRALPPWVAKVVPVEAQYSSSSSHESISSQSSLSTHSSSSSPPTSKKANSLSTGKSPPQSLDEERPSPLRTFRSPSDIPRTGTSSMSRPPLARADEVRSTDPPVSKAPKGDTASIYESAGKRGVCVRTLYACDADNESELSFEPNQIIVNVRSSKERGWLLGTLNGKTGLIPENYVQALQ